MMRSSSHSISERRQGLSWWYLCLLFVLALMLFLLLRWQPDAWLQAQLGRQARQHGMVVQYERLHLDGFSLHLDHLSIRAPRLPVPIKMDALSIAPAWTALLTMHPAVYLVAASNGQRIEMLLSWRGDHIAISGLQADLDVAQLQPFWQQRLTLPIHVGGSLIVTGDMQLDAASGKPVGGNLKVQWHAATTDVTGLDKPLGDYQLLLKADKASATSWQWTLAGGSILTLSGQGVIHIAGALLRQWGVDGRIRLQSNSSDNAIASMLGNSVAAFSLSGNLLKPRWQAVAVDH